MENPHQVFQQVIGTHRKLLIIIVSSGIASINITPLESIKCRVRRIFRLQIGVRHLPFHIVFHQPEVGMNPFIQSQGFAKTGMLTVVIGALLNLILDPIFIYGFGWGVRGAALATILSQMVSAVWVIGFLCGKRAIMRLRLFALRPQPGLSCAARRT